MLDQTALDLLFTQARSHNDFDPTPVGDAQLHALYDLMKMGPTSANCCPARLVFVTSDEAKARLMPHIIESNIEKIIRLKTYLFLFFFSFWFLDGSSWSPCFYILW